MSLTVTYKCDRCNHTQSGPATPRQFYSLTVHAAQINPTFTSGIGLALDPKTVHVCNKCATDKFLFVRKAADVPPQTLDQVLGEIVEAMVADAMSNRS